MVAEEYGGDGVLLLGYIVDLGPEGEFLEGEEVDILQRPQVEQVFLQNVPITLVPLKFMLRLNRQVRLPTHAELHTRQKLRPQHVGSHCHPHHLHLLSPNQQQHSNLLQQFKPHDVLGLPIVQDGDKFQRRREDIDSEVISENQQHLVDLGVGAVHDVLRLPTHRTTVEVQPALVVGH